MMSVDFLFFFFQAEDGIRDYKVMEFRRVLFRSVDAYHDYSKLLIARPHAMSSKGASAASWRGRTRSDPAMLAKGLATMVLTPARLATNSSSPGSRAQPPASTTWSTWLYEVEVKKNCSARVTSKARVSMNGCSTSAS